MLFENRRQAGLKLAQYLEGLPLLDLVKDPVVVALPRGGHPTIAWRDFVSSHYRSFGKRRIGVQVGNLVTDQDLFGAYGDAPVKTSLKYGTNLDGTSAGVPPLTTGKYSLRISYRERYRFGGMSLSRETSSSVPFSVE